MQRHSIFFVELCNLKKNIHNKQTNHKKKLPLDCFEKKPPVCYNLTLFLHNKTRKKQIQSLFKLFLFMIRLINLISYRYLFLNSILYFTIISSLYDLAFHFKVGIWQVHNFLYKFINTRLILIVTIFIFIHKKKLQCMLISNVF